MFECVEEDLSCRVRERRKKLFLHSWMEINFMTLIGLGEYLKMAEDDFKDFFSLFLLYFTILLFIFI